MKRSYSIVKARFSDLLKKLTEFYGYPTVFEELVLYSQDDSGLRITISSKHIRISWFDSDGGLGEFRRRKKNIQLPAENLKSVLEFVFWNREKEVQMNQTAVFKFKGEFSETYFSLRPSTLVGPLLSVEFNGFSKGSLHEEEYFENCLLKFREYISDDLATKVSKIEVKTTKCIISTPAGELLATTILDFCKKNGITNPLGRPYTYSEIQNARSNDYSTRGLLFSTVTGSELLATNSKMEFLPKKLVKVSVIVPYYNSAESINWMLRGISGQKGLEKLVSEVEVIIVDDGSELLASDAVRFPSFDFEIKIVRLSSNSGVSQARNIGTIHASGGILIFLDSDIIVSENYIHAHVIRNMIIEDAVFVSFKENVDRRTFFGNHVQEGPLSLPGANYAQDLRVSKSVKPGKTGSYKIEMETTFNILEETNYLKDFNGARRFGVYDLSCMITGHNFSASKETILESKPFSKSFMGWGMEDVYLGLRVIACGKFIIPTLSSGVYHLDHSPRSGSEQTKQMEYDKNTKLIDYLLASPASTVFE